MIETEKENSEGAFHTARGTILPLNAWKTGVSMSASHERAASLYTILRIDISSNEGAHGDRVRKCAQ